MGSDYQYSLGTCNYPIAHSWRVLASPGNRAFNLAPAQRLNTVRLAFTRWHAVSLSGWRSMLPYVSQPVTSQRQRASILEPHASSSSRYPLPYAQATDRRGVPPFDQRMNLSREGGGGKMAADLSLYIPQKIIRPKTTVIRKYTW